MAISRSQVIKEAVCLTHFRLMNKWMGWDRQDRHTAQLIKKEKKEIADGRRGEDKDKDNIVETELSRACGLKSLTLLVVSPLLHSECAWLRSGVLTSKRTRTAVALLVIETGRQSS